MYSVSFRKHLLHFAPNFRANFAESGKTFWPGHLFSSLKFVGFFVNSVDFKGSRKSEKLYRR